MVAALITTVSGSASPCSRAAMLGVSPKASCSCCVAAANLADDDQPGVNADAHWDAALLRQADIQRSHGLHNPKPGPHGALRIIFMRHRIAKVHQQAIAQILRDMPLIAVDHLGAGLLIGPHHLPQLFGVELLESAVEPTRSQNITVSWRRSASGGADAAGAGASGSSVPSGVGQAEGRAGQTVVAERAASQGPPARRGCCPARHAPRCWASISSNLRSSIASLSNWTCR